MPKPRRPELGRKRLDASLDRARLELSPKAGSLPQVRTPTGTMEGRYQFIAADGREFEAEIPRFVLSAERVLH